MGSMTDPTTELIIKALREHNAAEPPQDAGLCPSDDTQREYGTRWREWSETKRAYERMLAPRLIKIALESGTAAVKPSLSSDSLPVIAALLDELGGEAVITWGDRRKFEHRGVIQYDEPHLMRTRFALEPERRL